MSDDNEIQQLQGLVARYRVCWDVYADKVIDSGLVQQDGYRLELYGTHPNGVDHVDPGCSHCVDVWNALRSVAEWITPKDQRDLGYEISVFDRGIHYSRSRDARADVELHLRIIHRCGFGPVDACETACLSEMKEKLVALHAPQERWHEYHPGSTIKKLLASVLLALALIATAEAQTIYVPDEANTIAVFKRARLGIVHINVRYQESEPQHQGVFEQGMGSGFLIDSQGHVLTNYHVIERSNAIDIFLPGGRQTSARLIGTAPGMDLALLEVKLRPEDAVEALPLGDSDKLEIGQKVISIGNPMALHNTLSVGVLSAVGRTIPGAPVELGESLLQTDAAVNPGNSGGPLLDSSGRVIGVTTARIPDAQNLAFAIPINLAKRVIPDLITMGHPYGPSLGIAGTQITPQLADLFGLPVRSGFLIENIQPLGLANRAGLRAGKRVVMLGDSIYVLGGDVITAIDGRPVSTESQIAKTMLLSKPGQTLRLTIMRDGGQEEVLLRLEEMH
jgi:S1-C subfamily serine protease